MQEELVELQDRVKKTILFITHDLDEALKLGDRIAIMKDGVIVQLGTPEEILTNPADDYVDSFVTDVDLEDPLKIYGGEETINMIARQGLDADAPDVANFLQNMFLTGEQLGAVIGAIANGQEPLAAARQWISENEDVVNGWL